MYEVIIKIKSKEGFNLVNKVIELSDLECILSISTPDLYAEAQQKEIVEGLDIDDTSFE